MSMDIKIGMVVHIVVELWVLTRILLQNFENLATALDANTCARLLTLRIIEPCLELVDRHVVLEVELLDDLVLGLHVC